MNDIEIRAEILRQIEREQIAPCEDLRVLVHHGYVTLEGCVETHAQTTLAAAAAHLVPGVRRVIDLIEVPDAQQRQRDNALAKRVKQALANRRLPTGWIDVRVLNGVVKLTGAVDLLSQRLAAETEVMSLKGVERVRSQIAVRAKAPLPRSASLNIMGRALGG